MWRAGAASGVPGLLSLLARCNLLCLVSVLAQVRACWTTARPSRMRLKIWLTQCQHQQQIADVTWIAVTAMHS